MTTITAPVRHPLFAPGRIQSRAIVIAASGLSGLLLFAMLRQVASGRILLPIDHAVWLPLHLISVIPAVPLGAYVLIRRKGDRLHKMLGRTWVMLMMVAALSSFGLRASGHLSWIHLLSLLTIVAIPRGVITAMRGNIASHQQTMTRVYLGLVIAGLFTFVPGRLLGAWLFG